VKQRRWWLMNYSRRYSWSDDFSASFLGSIAAAADGEAVKGPALPSRPLSSDTYDISKLATSSRKIRTRHRLCAEVLTFSIVSTRLTDPFFTINARGSP